MEALGISLPQKKHQLILATIKLMLEKGYFASTVDDICHEAGVTKGSFFHYFKTKEDIAKSSLDYFTSMQRQLFEEAPYHAVQEPWEKLQLYLDYYHIITDNDQLPKSCLASTFIQELSDIYPDIRLLCDQNYSANSAMLENILSDCLVKYTPSSPLNAEQLSQFFTSLHQGSLLYSRVKQENAIIKQNIEQFRQYVSLLFLK